MLFLWKIKTQTKSQHSLGQIFPPSEDREDPDIEIDIQPEDSQEHQVADSDCDDQSIGDSDGEDSRDTSPAFNSACGTKRVLTSSGSESGPSQPRRRKKTIK